MNKLLCIAACAFAAGFVAPAAAAPFDFGTLLQATHADFVAADADAKAHNDTLASECWEGADAYLSAQTQNGGGFVAPGPVVGVFSGFQDARDGVKFGLSVYETFKVTGKVPVPLEQACGPLFLDSLDDVRTVGNAVGLGALNVVVAGKPLF